MSIATNGVKHICSYPKVHAAVNRWRSLSVEEQQRENSSHILSSVVASMALEGEPVSREWITRHTSQQAQAETCG